MILTILNDELTVPTNGPNVSSNRSILSLIDHWLAVQTFYYLFKSMKAFKALGDKNLCRQDGFPNFSISLYLIYRQNNESCYITVEFETY